MATITETPLNDSETFTSKWFRMGNFKDIHVSGKSDKLIEMKLQFSFNKSDIEYEEITHAYPDKQTIVAIPIRAVYFRAVLTNISGENTTYLRCYHDQVINNEYKNDTYGRHRVSDIVPVFSSKFINDLAPSVWDTQAVSGSGTLCVHQTDQAMALMSVSENIAGKHVMQSMKRINYIPGRALCVYISARLGNQPSGVTTRVGYFDSVNGPFFQSSGGVISIGFVTNVSGSPVTTLFPQSEWNIDPMDGSGKSRHIINFDSIQSFIFEMSWSGTGILRCGFKTADHTHYAHAVSYANGQPIPCISNPNLPIRFEITNDGTGTASDIALVSSAIHIEGGNSAIPHGFLRHASLSLNERYPSGTNVAILLLRLKSDYVDSVTINPLTCGFHTPITEPEPGQWHLVHNIQVTGPLTWYPIPSSAVEFTYAYEGVNTIIGGDVIDGGFTDMKNVNLTSPDSIWIGNKIDGSSTILGLRIYPPSTTTNIRAYATWKEIH